MNVTPLTVTQINDGTSQLANLFAADEVFSRKVLFWSCVLCIDCLDSASPAAGTLLGDGLDGDADV